ncbi:hypothetical protein ACRYCC_35155 [Actinomadura scrupuli]|uniref:helix-turn-helix domain-containing protein n=1 Tax=Actinomadura scrupuli TaxID=559629 RepID=UPI003D958FBE
MASANGQEPSREEVAGVVRALIKATGLKLAELAEQTHYSAQSWSAYQNDKRRIPQAALGALLEVSSSAPTDLTDRAQHLLRELKDARQPVAGAVEVSAAPAADLPATTDTAASPLTPQQDPAPIPPPEQTEGPAAAPPQARSGRARAIGASLIGVIVVFGVATAVINFVLPPGDRSRPTVASASTHPGHDSTTALSSPHPLSRTTRPPAPHTQSPEPSAQREPQPKPPPPTRPIPPTTATATCQRNHYKVDRVGDMRNEAGESIDQVVPGDIFIRDTSNTHPTMRYRYYGTVTGRGTSGYVMQEKLTSACA